MGEDERETEFVGRRSDFGVSSREAAGSLGDGTAEGEHDCTRREWNRVREGQLGEGRRGEPVVVGALDACHSPATLSRHVLSLCIDETRDLGDHEQ